MIQNVAGNVFQGEKNDPEIATLCGVVIIEFGNIVNDRPELSSLTAAHRCKSPNSEDWKWREEFMRQCGQRRNLAEA